jgi:hypothetical protein
MKGQTLIELNKTGKADILADGQTDLNQKLKLNLASTCYPSRMGVGFRFWTKNRSMALIIREKHPARQTSKNQLPPCQTV